MPMGGMLDDYKKGNNQARISLWDECLIATQRLFLFFVAIKHSPHRSILALLFPLFVVIKHSPHRSILAWLSRLFCIVIKHSSHTGRSILAWLSPLFVAIKVEVEDFTSLDFCSQGQVFYLKVCAEHYQHAANECLQLEGKDDDELVKLRFH
jgi:hypothetical protein